MTVTIHLKEQSQPIEHIDVVNAYSKGGYYCLYMKGEFVYKYPKEDIFRIKESYK